MKASDDGKKRGKTKKAAGEKAKKQKTEKRGSPAPASLSEERESGIGTLGERTLHSLLKLRYEPDPACHEVTVCGYVADIYRDGRITEIQTGNFTKMKKKLAVLLEYCPVNVVYPIERKKTIVWIDPESGEATEPRKSPKIGNIYDGFRELCSLGELLRHPALTVTLLPFDVCEQRLQDGWGKGGKRGCHRVERIPTAYGEEKILHGAEDFLALIPDSLPEEFRCADFSAACGIRSRPASYVLLALTLAGAVERIGRDRHGYLYVRCGEKDR